MKTHYLKNETEISCKTKANLGFNTALKTSKQWARVTCAHCLKLKTKVVSDSNGARK